MTTLPVLLLALASLPDQDPEQAGRLRALAASAPPQAVVEHVTRFPDDAPEAVRRLLLEAAAPQPADPDPLGAADRIASAFAEAWQDSSLVWRVAGFRRRTPGQRSSWAKADSLLQAGRAALYRERADSAIALWQAAGRRFTNLGDSAGIAAALGNIGAAFYTDGALDSAGHYLERGRQLARAARAPRVVANATVTLGAIAAERGDLDRARGLYREALALHTRIGDQRGIAADHHNLGELAETMGDLPAARLGYETALALNRRHGHGAAAATNLEGLGNVAAERAEHAAAAARYAEALAIYRDHDEPLNAAHVLLNLGLLGVRRGDYPGALAALTESATIYERAGSAADLVEVRRALSVARAATGDLEGATADLEAAADAAGGANLGPSALAGIALARADLEAQFNRLAEAERRYREAAALYQRAGDAAGRAEAQQGLAVLLLEGDEPSEALDLLSLALRTQEAEGATRAAAWTRVAQAQALRRLGQLGPARERLREATVTFARLGDPVSQAAARAEMGDLEREAGAPRSAEAHYREGRALLGTRAVPAVAWQLDAGLGSALAARQADAEAAEVFRRAIGEVEAVASDLARPERRTAFLADKWEVYARLAHLETRRHRAAAAFEASERMRARQMLETLGRGRTVAADAGVQELVDREQELRRRIDVLAGGLARPADPSSAMRDVPPADAAGITVELERLRGEHAEVSSELGRRAPRLGALVAGGPVRADAIARRLGTGQALVEYLVGDSTTVAFVVTGDTIAAVDLNVGRRTLAHQVSFVRGVIAAHADPVARDAWRAPLSRLHRYLVAPLEQAGLLRGTRLLVIVPHAELHYLPFEALTDGKRFLLERYEVSYAPSASVWVRLQERPVAPAAGRVLALAPRTDALPGSLRELETIGRLYGPRARLVAGAGATERVLRDSVAGYETVHLATFGVLNRRNPLSSHVALESSGGDDGRLEVREVFGLDLRARVVVLSACETAAGAGPLGDVPAGDEWLSLMRAFLQAGAANVVATLWPVADAESAGLIGRFFASLHGGATPSAALARAKRLVAGTPRTAHPFYWAGFVIGGGA